MKKIVRPALIAVAVCSLVGCADTSELYPGNAYVGSVFINNRYHEWPESLKKAEKTYSKTIYNEEKGFFNGSGKYDEPKDCRGFDQAKSWHPNYFKNEDGTQLYWTSPDYGSDIINAGIGTYQDQSPLYGIVYSQTKKLSRTNEAFSKGYLSKLYNGQVRCNGWSYYSWVVLDQEGYGTMFPGELSEAEYFAFVLRGGRDTDDGGKGNVVSFGIDVSFYRYKDDGKTMVRNSILLDDVKVQANFASNWTSLVGFTFKDVGISPKGIVGMSISITSLDDPYVDQETGDTPSMDFSDGKKIHTGICLMEVLLPDSTWF